MPDRRLATAAAPLVLLGALGWGAPVVADEEWTRSMASARTALLGGELGEARRWIDAASRRSQNFGDADWRRADTLEIAGALAIARGELATASKVLAEAADAYTALFGDDSAPLVLNGVERGRVALADGDIDRAEKSFNAAIVLAKSLPTGGGRGVAGAHLGLADIAMSRGDLTAIHTALDDARTAASDDPRARVEVALATAVAQSRLGDRDAARRALDTATAAVGAVTSGGGFLTATVAYLDGILALNSGKILTASERLGEALNGWDQAGVREHPLLARALSAQATALGASGSPRDADAAMQRAWSMAQRTVSATHPIRADIARQSALHALQQGNFRDAEKRAKAALGKTPAPDVSAALLAILVETATARGDLNTAAEHAHTIKRLAAQPGITPAVRLSVLTTESLALRQIGHLDGASAALNEAIEASTESGAARSPGHAKLLTMLARVEAERLGASSAANAITAAVDAVMIQPAPQPGLIEALMLRSALERARGRTPDADASLDEALRIASERSGRGGLDYADILREKGQLETDAGQVDAAQATLATALGIAQKALPARHPSLLTFQLPLAQTLLAVGKSRDAASMLRSATSSATNVKNGVLRARLALVAARIDAAQGRTRDVVKQLDAANEALIDWPAGSVKERVSTAITLERAAQAERTGKPEVALAAFGDQPPADWEAHLLWGVARAQVLIDNGRPDEALKALQETADAAPADAASSTAVHLLNATANALATLGRTNDALDTQRRAVDEAAGRAGPEHSSTLDATLGLARIQRQAGRYTQAQDTLASLIEKFTGNGAESPSIVPALVEQARLNAVLGNSTGAQAALVRAQGILEKFLRAEHSSLLALSIERVAVALLSADWAEAQNLLSRLATPLRRLGNPNHPIALQAQAQLAELALARGQRDAARGALETMALATTSMPTLHPLKLRLLALQAELAAQEGDFSRVLELTKTAPPTYLALVAMRVRAAIALHLTDEALKRTTATRAELEASLGADHLDALSAAALQAEAQTAAGDSASAEGNLRDVLQRLASIAPDHPLLVTLETQLAGTLLSVGRLNDALKSAERSQSAASDKLGEQHPGFAASLTVLGKTLAGLGRFEQALGMLASAKNAHAAAGTSAHPDAIGTALALAQVQADIGQLDAAATSLQKATSALGRRDASAQGAAAMTPIIMQQTWLLMARGKFADAEVGFAGISNIATANSVLVSRASAAAALAALQANRLDAANTYADAVLETEPNAPDARTSRWLAGIVKTIANRELDAKTAKQQLQAILTSASDLMGADHPEVLGLARTAGLLCINRGWAASAITLLEQARDGAATFGPTHPLAVNSAIALAQARLDSGDLSGATSELMPYDGASATLPRNSAAALAVAQGDLLAAQGQPGPALDTVEQGVELTEQLYGSRHPLYAQRAVRLAGLMNQQERAGDAEPLLRRALAVLEQNLGTEHPGVAGALGELGNANLALGRNAAANTYFERQVKLLESAYGTTDARLSTPLTNLAELKAQNNQLDEALAALQRVRTIAASDAVPEAFKADAASRLAGVLVKQGSHKQAHSLYSEALEIYTRALAPEDTRLVSTLKSLAALSLLLGQPDDAAIFLQQVPASG